MNRKNLILGGVLAVALAALLVLPAWLSAAEPAKDETTTETRPGRGFLGVGLRELTPELQTHFGAPEGSGVLVASVSDDSPAAAAGIRVGDVITAVDGLSVDSTRDLSREIRHRPGASVAIELFRDGKEREVTAALGERQAQAWDRAWDHGGRSPEQWAEFAERWERWGEEFGEKWGQWGEEFGQRWGEEIGRSVEKALSEVDWDEIGRAVEQSMKSIEDVDWEEMSERIERRMEDLERHLEEQHAGDDGDD